MVLETSTCGHLEMVTKHNNVDVQLLNVTIYCYKGGEEDDCNCDGYAASMWTISINSAINDGQNAHYDESCSSTLASTFSNGAKDPNTGVVRRTFHVE